MALDAPIMFITIILICLTLAFPVAVMGWRDDGDGLRTWAIALCLLSVGVSLVVFRGHVPDFFSIVVANTIISISHSMFLRTINIFLGKKTNLLQVLLPPIVIAITFTVMRDAMLGRIIIGGVILFVQLLLAIICLLDFKYDFPRIGRNIIIFSVVVLLVRSLARVLTALIWPSELANIFESSQTVTIMYYSGFVLLILISNGFLIMAKERSDERLRTVAMRDKLTGCWNRIRIEEVAQQEMARLDRYGYPVSLIMIDLDHFKAVNDQYGHGAGDAILRGFADIARETLRSTDVLGRWGGEEFIVILPSSSLPEAVRIAERIRTNVERHLFSGTCRVTASLGVSVCLSTDSWDEWLERADSALYRAKNSGRNQTKTESIDIDCLDIAGIAGSISHINWQDDYQTGHHLIDCQHKRIFEILGGILSLREDVTNIAGIVVELRSFLDVIENHFSDEEMILSQYNNEYIDHHKNIHRTLIQRTRSKINDLENGKIGFVDVINFISYEVVAQHMLIEDRKWHQDFGMQDTEA
ncbi:MAG: diguanylate cyclase [Azospirillaceae bacterium]|nr:diguanylate cyclase [Azospirillaceae bacterium]